MEKQTIAVLGPGSWGTALSQVLNDNGHEVRIWGNIPEQINEINTYHTNKHYFKDVVLDENIIAYTDLAEALKDVDAILFVVPTKVTRLVAQQVAKILDHKVIIMHASKGLEPETTTISLRRCSGISSSRMVDNRLWLSGSNPFDACMMIAL